MKSARMRLGLLALLVLLAVTAACTNSEQLSSGVAPVPIRIMVVNSETRFDRALFDFTQVSVRPLDPDASAALGTDPLWMMKTTGDGAILIDLNSGDNQYETESQLTVGRYEVQSVAFSLLEFEDGLRLGNATCAEYVTDYPSISGPVLLFDFGEPVVFEVTLGSDNQLTMVIDGAALVSAFEDSWRCFQGAPICGFFPPVPDWCLWPNDPSAFDDFTFAEQASTFLSFP